MQVPFTGEASEELLHDVEDAVRAVLLARGYQGPDRSTVRGAMGVRTLTNREELLAFGRSMAGTHVLSGTVRPFVGQYTLTLTLYDVRSGRSAEQQRNVGSAQQEATITSMVEALFAPDAMQPTPEERARAEEERRRNEEAAAQRAREEEERRRRTEAEEQQRRETQAREEAARRERERIANQRFFAQGGRGYAGLIFQLGGRITDVPQRPMGAPPVSALYSAARLEGGYALFPALGPVALEFGGTVLIVGSPTIAMAFGPVARVTAPIRWNLPLRGSAGFAAGPFFSFTGARAASLWLAFDARAEYDVIPALTLQAGFALEGAPGVVGSLSFLVGARFRFGPAAENPM